MNIPANIFGANDSDKIMYVVEHILGAISPDTSVDMRTIVETGIEAGLTHDYPRGREDGHPWWPHTSVMMGVGENAENWEEIHLHRQMMSKNGKGKAMYYWVDRTRRHKDVSRKGKVQGDKRYAPKKNGSQYFREVKRTFTTDEMEKKMAENPGQFIVSDGKLYKTSFVVSHPEKFNPATVMMAKVYMNQ